ncbi:energy-coupling factor ABC transporter permease [Thalassospiraceae bacterium LMO-JJ14]|nr:energy-coupling factor ABC transporter permease [Thalassospiraceae bacterium LMO-JJ14]
MHMEPGVVDGAKLILSYATAAGSLGLVAKLGYETIKNDGGVTSLVARSTAATALVFSFFEILPHYPVGVSEVHLILGSTLFLILGAGPAAFGLAAGLLIQGVFFAPFDLPQYGMNITTLLVPLYAMSFLAGKIIPKKTAYKDIKYSQALALSTAYQAGIVSWVAFWALYGHGFGAENLTNVLSFGSAYMLVIIVEPLVDLGVLAIAKTMYGFKDSAFTHRRLYEAEAA